MQHNLFSLTLVFIASTIVLTSNLSVAQAKTIVLSPTSRVFQKGNTIVPEAVIQACQGDIVDYKTQYLETKLIGHFWIKKHAYSICPSNGGKMVGYFEERSPDGRQFCSGQMTMEFNGRGYHHIEWNEIKAVPNYSCPGAGKTFALFL
jgi:hypothetical protein